MCRGISPGVYTKGRITATVDLDVRDYLEKNKGSDSLSVQINALLRKAIYGEPVEC